MTSHFCCLIRLWLRNIKYVQHFRSAFMHILIVFLSSLSLSHCLGLQWMCFRKRSQSSILWSRSRIKLERTGFVDWDFPLRSTEIIVFLHTFHFYLFYSFIAMFRQHFFFNHDSWLIDSHYSSFLDIGEFHNAQTSTVWFLSHFTQKKSHQCYAFNLSTHQERYVGQIQNVVLPMTLRQITTPLERMVRNYRHGSILIKGDVFVRH